jgi:hypothetical protein
MPLLSKTLEAALLINSLSFQVKKSAVGKSVYSEQNENAMMDYYAQTTFATNRPDPVNIPQLIAFYWMIRAPLISALKLLAGVNSVVGPCWKHGQALLASVTTWAFRI